MMERQGPTNAVKRISPTYLPRSESFPDGMIQLLLVDDDDDYREAIGAELANYGFHVTDFDDGPPLIQHFASGNSADVVVLDWNLPSMTGIDLLPVLRRQGVRVPVIMLTGMSASMHEVEALDRGAAEFVDKSRGVPVLARRAHLITSAHGQPGAKCDGDVVEQGPLQLRTSLCRAYWQGRDVDLTVTEFDIVHKLVTHNGEHVSYRAIYDCVHHSGFIAGSGENGFRTNVRSSIKRIRNKFRLIDSTFAEIENFASFGYCWKKNTSSN